MSHATAYIRLRLPLLAGTLLIVLFVAVGCTGVARAEGFGEITRFGGPGNEQPGTLTPAKVNSFGDAFEFRPWHQIGVEPKTNDVFILEEYKEGKETAKTSTRFVRLQELSSTGALLGYKDITVKYATPLEENSVGNPEETEELDGIAVDSELGRVYFLLTGERGAVNKKEEIPEEGVGAALGLYAFKIAPNAKQELEPVAGTTEGLLTNFDSKLDSPEPGATLLSPHGITVDPFTHEILIAAHVADQPCEEPEKPGEEELCPHDELSNPEEHYAIQRVKENGQLGQLDVDKNNILKKPPYYTAPGSPVVVGSAGSERIILVNHLAEEKGELQHTLAEFPASGGEPKQLTLPNTGGSEQGFHEVVSEPSGDPGGSLAVSPEGTTLYGVTYVRNEEGPSPENFLAVSERSAETLQPIGWTGGARASATDACVLQPGLEEGEHIQIAAGGKGDIFVLVPEYLREPPARVGGGPFPTKDAIVEFGPGAGAKGCPQASAPKIAVMLAGKEIEGTEHDPVPAGKRVILTTPVKQGDALAVTWKIEHESTVVEEKQTNDQYQTVELPYTFDAPGKYKISEEIKTDNLDTPTLTVPAREVWVEEKKLHVVKQPKSITVAPGETAEFTATAAGTPGPSEVQWYVSTNGGTSFTEDTEDEGAKVGTTEARLKVKATEAKNGYEYYAVFKSTTGEKAETEHATLTVKAATKEPLRIVEPPKSATVKVGETAEFNAAATGAPAPNHVQWYVSTNGGKSFTEDTEDEGAKEGTTKAKLKVKATEAKNGYEYYAEFSSESNEHIHTEPAVTLTVTKEPLRIVEPPKSATVKVGETAEFNAAATGAPAPNHVQWYVSTNGGKSFTEDTEDEGAKEGTTKAKLKVKATEAKNGYEYYAEFSNESNEHIHTEPAVTLTVTKEETKTSTTPEETKTSTGPTTTPEHEVQHYQVVAPTATIASASTITVTPAGSFSLKISCATGATSCIGTVTLRTASAISVSGKKKKQVVMLAAGSFTISGGQAKAVTLHLSSQARELLAKDHQLRAHATVASHDAAQEVASTATLLTLRPAPTKHKR